MEPRNIILNQEDLKGVLAKINKDNLILYKDLDCQIRIGKRIIHSKEFDTLLQSGEDVFVLVKSDKLTDGMIRDILKNYPCHVVSLLNDFDFVDNNFGLVYSLANLESNIINTLQNGNNDCDFYPYIGGDIVVKANEKVVVKYDYRGLIMMGDKILFLMSQRLPQVNVDEIFKLMVKYNMDCHYFECGEPNLDMEHSNVNSIN